MLWAFEVESIKRFETLKFYRKITSSKAPTDNVQFQYVSKYKLLIIYIVTFKVRKKQFFVIILPMCQDLNENAFYFDVSLSIQHFSRF